MPKRQQRKEDGLQHTEMTFSANLAEWMNTIIRKERLPFGRAEVGTQRAWKTTTSRHYAL